MSDAATVLALLAGKSKVKVVSGFYRGLDGLRVLVEFDGGLVPCSTVTAYRPALNEPVWVASVDDQLFLLGPTRPLPADATVVSTASGIAELTTDIGGVSATYESGATLSAGQRVKLMWGGDMPHVISVKSFDPDAVVPPGASGSGVKEYTKTFTATQAGSYGSSWWQSQVWSSDNNLGAWFYGSKIPDTIPSGATIQWIEIYLSPQQIFGSPANFGLHNHTSKPGGAPTIGSLTATAPHAGWLRLPTSFGNALRRGGSAKGIGIEHGGFHIFRSLSEDAQSGALRIRYRA